MSRGRSDRWRQTRAAPGQADADPVPDLAERCRQESGWGVAHALSWEQVLALLPQLPQVGDDELTLVSGDYGHEGWESFGESSSLGELLRQSLDVPADADWPALCAALAGHRDPDQEIEVMEGDYGWEGWEESETTKPLSALVREGLAMALHDLHPYDPERSPAP